MRKTLLIPVIILALLFGACSGKQEVLSGRTFALDTLIELKIYAYPKKDSDTLIQDSFDLIRSFEDMLSAHIEGSDLDKLSQNAGIRPTTVDELTYRIIQDSTFFSEKTGGLFDVTIGPLVNLWAIDPPNGHYPSQEELDAVLPLIGYQKIRFLGGNQIKLPEKGMRIDLGAIAKGAIADEVKRFLLERGVTSALINLGGNVLTVGSKPGGDSFVIGIQDPNSARGEYLLSIHADDESVVSSGDYERYFVYEGKIYHHILNPKTGFPADTNIKQITIVTPNSQIAEGFSTSVLLLGVEKGIHMLESFEGVEAILISKDHYIYVTKGLRGKYETNSELIGDYTITDRLSDLY